MNVNDCLREIAAVAAELGLPPPEPLSAEEARGVLELTRGVAHVSERQAAPLTAYAVGRALAPADPARRIELLRAAIERIDGLAAPPEQASGRGPDESRDDGRDR